MRIIDVFSLNVVLLKVQKYQSRKKNRIRKRLKSQFSVSSQRALKYCQFGNICDAESE